jgi:hypothetical protein
MPRLSKDTAPNVQDAGPAVDRIKDAIRRIGVVHPDLGRHLARSVRTGTFCVYDPDQPARWSG